MSQSVYFNGTRLVKPGGASKIDASAFESVAVEGVGTIAIIGEAKNGKPLEWLGPFTSGSAMEQYFGTGDLADAASVAFKPLNDARIGDAHAQQVYVYKTNNGTQSAKTFNDGSSHDVVTLTTVDYGTASKGTTVKIEYQSGSTGRKFTIVPQSSDVKGRSTEVISVTDAECEKLKVWYVGASSAPTISTSDADVDGLIDTLTLTSTVTAESMTIDLVGLQLTNINALVSYINANGGGFWGASVGASTNDRFKFSPRQLDTLSSVAVGTALAPTSVYAKLQQCLDRINNESQIVSAAFPVGAVRAVPAVAATPQALTGGTDGTTGAGALAAALEALEVIDAPGVVVLSTSSADAVLLEAHCAKMSGTAGKKERTGYIGLTGTKTELINAAQTINSPHICLFVNKWTGTNRFSQQVVLPEWAWALAAASARAGMEFGEPLTWKYFASQNVTQASSTWSPDKDGDDMILAGLCIAQKDRRGCKLVKGITSYTRLDNDVYTEESIITNVKAMVKGFRELLELRYTGRKASVQSVSNIRADGIEYWGSMREQGRIVDSITNGQVTKLAYRKLEVRQVRDVSYVDVEISPVSGINFQLETIRIVPATLSV